MKTTLLFLSVFISAYLFGQNVNIPDANLKAYLVGNSAINTNSDTEIQLSEAGSYMWEIDITGYRFVSDLTGIEAFTALTELYLADNQLTSLDISKNIALTVLQCDNNQLTSLDISKNIALTELLCDNNQLTSLDVSKNSTLFRLSCVSNNFECVKGVSIYCDLPAEYRCDDSFNQSIDVSNTTYNPNLDYWGQEIKTSSYLANVNGKVVFSNAELKCLDGQVMEVTFNYKNDSIKSRKGYKRLGNGPEIYIMEERFKKSGDLKSKECWNSELKKIDCPED